MDLYFNNSIFFFAFVVVALIVFISMIIFARDIVLFVVRRFRKKADQDKTEDRREAVDGKDF